MPASTPRRSGLRAWLRLLRVANLPTVPGDPIVGYVVAAGVVGWPVLPCAAASLCLYCAGLLANDYFDLAEDRRDRIPDYPLLCTRRRFWEACFQAVDAAGTHSQLRSQLRILHDSLHNVAEQALGTTIPASDLFNALAPSLVNTGVLLNEINTRIQSILDQATDPWGIKVVTVEVKHIDLPQEMQRAMARQAEAERERRAKVINAEGEFQAAQKLADASAIIGQHPVALQLRFLQTLTEVASENNSTTVFPVPVDLFAPFFAKKEEES